MAQYSPARLARFPWIVSTGTLRLEDLLPSYWSAAETLKLELPAPLVAELERLVGADSSADDWSDDAADAAAETLWELLNDAAPCGFYFGASEGDGACFGFWLSDDWRDALEERSIKCETPEHLAALLQELDDHGVTAETLYDAYCGIAEGMDAESAGADYAQQLAEDCGDIDWRNLRWPLTCIDWDAAWRELELNDGYSAIPAQGVGTFHIIRSV